MRSLWIVLLAACSSPETVWLDMPGDEEAETIVIGLYSDELRVFAYPAGEAITLPALIAEDTRRIEAVLFRDSLEALGIDSGELLPDEGATIGELESFAGAYTAVRRGIGFEDWIDADLPSDELAAFPIGGTAVDVTCGPLVGSRIFVPAQSSARFLLSLGDEVLLGSDNGHLFRIREESFEEITIDPRVTLESGAQDELGRLWFVSRGTRTSTLWTGTLEQQNLSLAFTATVSGLIARIAISRTEPIEIVAIERTGAWLVYDRTFRVILPSTSTERTKVADFTMVDGHVAGMHGHAIGVSHYQDGELTTDYPPLGDRLRAVEQIDGLGLVISSSNGTTWVKEFSSWRTLGTTPGPPTDIVPTKTGFFIGTDLGVVQEYTLAEGYCQDDLLPSQGESTVIGAPLGDGAVFSNFYQRNDDGPLPVFFVRRQSD